MRIALTVMGLATLAAAWMGPLPEMARHAFFAHMTMHMVVVAVAAPLLALAVAGSSWDPVPHVPRFFAPIPASVAELILVWAWHAPALHHAARTQSLGLVAEQGSFLLAGVWVWLSAFGGRPVLRRAHHPTAGLGAANERFYPECFFERTAAGIVGLLLTSMHMTLLGALLALSPRPLYAHHGGFAGMTPLQDQHLGGAVMLLVGGLAYLIGGLWLTRDLLKKGHWHRLEQSV